MKTAIDYIFKFCEPLIIALYLYVVLATAYGSKKLDWFDAAFLIAYTFLVRKI
jgi:hypothetical protein